MTPGTRLAAHHAADAHALAAWLRTQRYLAVRVLPDGSVAALAELLYTRSIVLGCHWEGWTYRFCFEDRALADRRFAELRSEDDVPEGHLARRYGGAPPDRPRLA